jgi:hypothetical protein
VVYYNNKLHLFFFSIAVPSRNTELKDEDNEDDLRMYADTNPLENQRLTSQVFKY